MDTAMLIEIFGYIGSVLVVVSMLMSSVVKLRIINTVGSIVSGIYALICGAFPLVLMNSCLIIINIYNLFKLLKTTQNYDMFDAKADDSSVVYFVNRYKDDIMTYFPDFDASNVDADQAYVVCCDGNPAGLFLGKTMENHGIDVLIDYSTPAYRDCSVGTYLYSQLPGKGIKAVQFAKTATETHVAYMAKVGFVKENNVYIKKM